MSEIIIRLSPDTPQEVIQQILALVVPPQEREGRIHNATVAINTAITVKASPDVQASFFSSADVKVTLIPQAKTVKASFMGSLAVLLIITQLAYYVSGTADHTVQFLEHLKPHIRETKIDGSVVPFDQVKCCSEVSF
jgi:hypothetical protein